MNTKLRKNQEKLDDGQTGGGNSRLTKVVIDKRENYYDTLIRQNDGDLRIKENAIWLKLVMKLWIISICTAPKCLSHDANISYLLQMQSTLIHKTHIYFPYLEKK